MLDQNMILEAILTSIKETMTMIYEDTQSDEEWMDISTLVDDENSPIGVTTHYDGASVRILVDLECLDLWSIGRYPRPMDFQSLLEKELEVERLGS